MSNPTEFEWEPQPGIPAPLPEGEHIIWQGSPNWIALAIDAFHVRKVGMYFLFIVLLDVTRQLSNGADKQALLAGPALTLILCVGAIGILASLAWLSASATIYTLTNQRLLIRFGIAIQLTINLPFKQIVAADVAVNRNGTGNIPLQVATGSRVSYLVLWPHVRPWRFRKPQPMLRAIPDAAEVATLIADTIRSAAPVGTVKTEPTGTTVASPAPIGMGTTELVR